MPPLAPQDSQDFAQLNISVQTVLGSQTISALASKVNALSLNLSSKSELSFFDGELPGKLDKEAVLDETIIASKEPLLSNKKQEAVLLAGSTGFLGSRLLTALLKQFTGPGYCIVHGEESSGLSRIVKAIEQVQTISDEMLARIIPIAGDLSKTQLGIGDKTYELLTKHVSDIYHCAANVNFVLPRQNLFKSNVEGTVQLLRLACTGQPKKLNYISTVSVFPTIANDSIQTFYEDDSLFQGQAIVGGYPQSKWIAERMIDEAHSRGIEANVFRPGVSFGDSRTNQLPSEVLLVEFIKISIDLGSAPDLDILIDFAPVDYVASAVVEIGRYQRNENFHLNNPSPLHLREFLKLINEAGIVVKVVSALKWTEVLENINETRASDSIKTLISMIENVNDAGPVIFGRNLQRFDCKNTLAALKNTSISCPAINASLIEAFKDNLVSRYRRRLAPDLHSFIELPACCYICRTRKN